MIDGRRDLSEQAAARRATRRPVLIAIGATGGVEALRLGHTIATRYGSDVVVTSAVEPPPVYSFESNRAILLPWLLEQQVGERSESVDDRVQRFGGWPLGADE